MPGGAQATAVIVDRWPLVRLGLRGVLGASGVEVVAEAAKVSEGLLVSRSREVDLLIFGTPADGLSPSAIRSAKHDERPPKVVVLVSSAASAELAALFAAGADALLETSVGPAELTDALRRLRGGERVVGPTLGPAVRRRPPPDDAAGDVHGPGPDERGPLTAKEREVLALLAQGHSNKQIARALFVSDATVKTHLQHIYAKLAVQSRHGALSRAGELGLLG